MRIEPNPAGIAEQARLIRALQNPAAFGPDIGHVRLLETHISYVLLTGPYAYKIKKAVNLGFLDFTTLAARRHDCHEELRLNRRLAPAIYQDVVAVTGSVDNPEIAGAGPALEYAVKMREFSQDALLSQLLARGGLTTDHIDALASRIAAFHQSAAVAGPDAPFGRPDDIRRFALENFSEIRSSVKDESNRVSLEGLRQWTEQEYAAQARMMEGRRREGFVRECHGDLHAGNIALVDGEIIIFDCLEFNDDMRWMDTMSEIAFVVMDLQDRKRPDLAARLLNTYLEITGDYAGLGVLPFYLAYRAMVRAKVACLRAAQIESGPSKTVLMAEYRGYVDLAMSYMRSRRPAIIITHGLAGSGKTTLSQMLLELIGAVRIRTDIERKRLHGLLARDRSGSPVGGGMYTAAATEQTYRRVSGLARSTAESGFVTIVDGAFLRRPQRDLFRRLAAYLGIPFVIVTFDADAATLRDRVARRAHDSRDASEADVAVLEHQRLAQEALGSDERTFAVSYDAEAPLARGRSALSWKTVIERLATSKPWIPRRIESGQDRFVA
jgi:aminoglycoside phosphotransferase family enzyme/predicted kinase